MSTPYTGVPRPAAGGTIPAPSPIVTSTSIPLDAEANNAATMFLGQYKSFADQLSWIGKAVQPCPAVLPSLGIGGTIGGFSAVTHVGPGSGTVAPSGSVKITTGTNFVVKIILGGAV